jgi:hypothetical protein
MAAALPPEGATLLVPSGPRKHLFVVLTKPSGLREHILIVGINSVRDGEYHDPACVLYAGDHPFLTRPSFVAYRFAKVVDGISIRQSVADGYFLPRERMSDDVFDRICHGLVMSRHTKPSINTFYVNRPD